MNSRILIVEDESLVALDLRQALEEFGLEVAGERCRMLIEASTVPSAGGPIHITVSIGGALLEKGTSARMAFDRADSVLYASKSNRRNRSLVVDRESPASLAS
jgi:GGDEF domain-containing protein